MDKADPEGQPARPPSEPEAPLSGDVLALLARSQERLQLALEISGLALWDFDVARDRIVLTKGWARMLGLPPAPIETTRAELLALVPEEDRAPIEQGLRSLLAGQGTAYAAEHRVRRADGTMAWVDSQGKVAQRDAQGRPQRLIGTNRDITEARRAAEDLRQARDAADAANQAKSDFLATISHEIRTPLNGIVGLSRLLLDEALEARARQHAELIDSSAQTLLALVNDVLDLSKIEAGQLQIEQVTFNLHELVEEVANLYRQRAAQKSLLFRLHLDAAVPRHVSTDPVRVRQVLSNLLGNALKFTRRGWIGLHVGPAPGHASALELVVTDTGAGIPEAMQPKLFTPFVQAESATTRKFGGTGLGLSIVKQLCEALGGSVQLKSRQGKGTRFTVVLPYAAAASDHVSTWQDAIPAAAPSRILVAEDNTTNQVVVMGMLAKLGYTDVGLAQDGTQALSMGRDNSYDVILMDCQMPEMDGYEATRLLRAAGCTSAIVAMTANAIKGDRERCLAAGMDDYLTKPITLREFGETLAAWAARRGRSAWSTLSPSGDLASEHAPLPQAPARQVFNAAACMERYGNDEQLLALSVHTFLRTAPATFEQLDAAARTADAREIRRLAHAAHGSAAMVGAEQLADLAGQLELDSGWLDANQARERVARLREAFATYHEEMRPAASSETAVGR